MKTFVLINAVVFLLYGVGFMFFPESLSSKSFGDGLLAARISYLVNRL